MHTFKPREKDAETHEKTRCAGHRPQKKQKSVSKPVSCHTHSLSLTREAKRGFMEFVGARIEFVMRRLHHRAPPARPAMAPAVPAPARPRTAPRAQQAACSSPLTTRAASTAAQWATLPAPVRACPVRSPVPRARPRPRRAPRA